MNNDDYTPGKFVVTQNPNKKGFCIGKIMKILDNHMLRIIIMDDNNNGEERILSITEVRPLLKWLDEVNTIIDSVESNKGIGNLTSPQITMERITLLKITKIVGEGDIQRLFMEDINPHGDKRDCKIFMKMIISK